MDEGTTLYDAIKELAIQAYNLPCEEMLSDSDLTHFMLGTKYTPDIVEVVGGKEYKIKDGGFFTRGGNITIKQN